mgnify:CR=1 FL=1
MQKEIPDILSRFEKCVSSLNLTLCKLMLHSKIISLFKPSIVKRKKYKTRTTFIKAQQSPYETKFQDLDYDLVLNQISNLPITL